MSTTVTRAANPSGNVVTAETNSVTGRAEFNSAGSSALHNDANLSGVARSDITLNGLLHKMRLLQGSNADERHLSALEKAIRPLVFSSAWQKIRELWVPTGTNLAAALVKIKAPYNDLPNESLVSVNFVDADYVPTIGLIGDGTSKYLYSQTTPNNAKRTSADSAGCVVKQYGFAVYPTSPVHSPSGILLGATSGSVYRVLGQAGASVGGEALGSNGLNREVSSGTPTGHRARMQFIQNRDNLAMTGTGALIEAQIAATESSVGTNKVILFAGNNGSNGPIADSYYNGPISGYALFDSLTDAELLELSRFFDDLNFALGRIGNDILFFGDSNAANTGVFITQRWAYRVAHDLGFCRFLVTATRARTSNVATLTFAAAHNLRTGDSVSVINAGGSSYNTDSGITALATLPTAQITVVDATTISYPSIGSNEAQTADTNGYVLTGYRNIATNGSTVSSCPTIGTNGSANTYNRWTWPVWTTGSAPAPRLGFLYRVLQFPAALYIFNIGTNDCAFKGDIVDFEASYRATLTQLVSAGISMRRVLLTSLLFGNYVFPPPAVSNRTDALAVAYNQVIANIAADFGCKYVDLYSLWDSSNYQTYLLDESGTNGGYTNWVHANAAGCELIYRRVMQAVSVL